MTKPFRQKGYIFYFINFLTKHEVNLFLVTTLLLVFKTISQCFIEPVNSTDRHNQHTMVVKGTEHKVKVPKFEIFTALVVLTLGMLLNVGRKPVSSPVIK